MSLRSHCVPFDPNSRLYRSFPGLYSSPSVLAIFMHIYIGIASQPPPPPPFPPLPLSYITFIQLSLANPALGVDCYLSVPRRRQRWYLFISIPCDTFY